MKSDKVRLRKKTETAAHCLGCGQIITAEVHECDQTGAQRGAQPWFDLVAEEE